MKKLSYIFAFIALLPFLGSCSYDDSLLREEIGKIEEELSGYERQVMELESQMSSLTAIVNSSFISYLGTDEAGNYVISYMEEGGEVKTLTLALDSDVVTSPIIGTREDEDGKLYWCQTPDNGTTWDWILDSEGKKMPVGGIEPEVSIDSGGYWTVNGARVPGADGNPVLADDVSNILFSGVEYDEESGLVVFSLADGTSFSVRMYESLGITFDASPVVAVPDPSVPVRLSYNVTGTDAADAVVDWFSAWNVTVEIDKYARAVTVTLDEGAEEGNTLIMVSYGKNVVFKPLFFTAGTAEIQHPVWDDKYGTGQEIVLEGDLTEFDIEVSHNIDYTMTISEDCSDWLREAPAVKADMVTTTHSFIADYYENDSGADRTGTIIFYNRPYDVSVELTVRQSPVIPEGPDVPGISTGADLNAFVKAVNSGASTSRWQNEAGDYRFRKGHRYSCIHSDKSVLRSIQRPGLCHQGYRLDLECLGVRVAPVRLLRRTEGCHREEPCPGRGR